MVFRVLLGLVLITGITMVSAVRLPASDPQGADEPSWSLPDERLGVRTVPLLLLSRPDVQDDLGLQPEQIAEAFKAIRHFHQRALELHGQTGPEAVAARRAIDHDMHTWLNEALTEAQRRRLGQIDLQWEGASALWSRPTVAEALGLTADQRRSLQGLHAQFRSVSAASPLERHRAFNRQALERLTEDQRRHWQAMTGPRFQPRIDESAPEVPASESR